MHESMNAWKHECMKAWKHECMKAWMHESMKALKHVLSKFGIMGVSKTMFQRKSLFHTQDVNIRKYNRKSAYSS